MTDCSFERFCELAHAHDGMSGARVVPVWREILFDRDTAVSAFRRIRRDPFAFLLESAPAGSETWSRYTFLGTEPSSAWRLADGTVEEWMPQQGWFAPRRPPDPLADLEEAISRALPVNAPWLGPFWGGAVGFLGYDIVRLIEKLPSPPPKSSNTPDALFIFTRCVVIIDNLRSLARIVVSVTVDGSTDLPSEFDKAMGEIADMQHRL